MNTLSYFYGLNPSPILILHSDYADRTRIRTRTENALPPPSLLPDRPVSSNLHHRPTKHSRRSWQTGTTTLFPWFNYVSEIRRLREQGDVLLALDPTNLIENELSGLEAEMMCYHVTSGPCATSDVFKKRRGEVPPSWIICSPQRQSVTKYFSSIKVSKRAHCTGV